MIKKVVWMWQSNKGNLLERVQFKVLDEEILNRLWEEKCHGIGTTIEFFLKNECKHDYEIIARMIIMINFTTIGLNITLLMHKLKITNNTKTIPQCCKVCHQRIIFHVKNMKMQSDMKNMKMKVVFKIGFDESSGNFIKYIHIYLMIETM